MDRKEIKKKAVRDFIKAYSCSFSVTKNLSQAIGFDAHDDMLRGVVGLGGGICSMQDTCGSVNAGVAMLGRIYPESRLPGAPFYALCSEYYLRIATELFRPDCALVHGADEAAGGKEKSQSDVIRNCSRLVRTSMSVMLELREDVDGGGCRYLNNHDMKNLERINGHFCDRGFHCCNSVLRKVGEKTGVDVANMTGAGRGYCGGIGFNGTVCGAVIGGVFALGLHHSVDLKKATYLYTMRVTLGKILKGNRIFEDEGIYKPARLYRDGRRIYGAIKNKYGSVHCRGILGLDLEKREDCDAYIRSSKIRQCQDIVEQVADAAVACMTGEK